MKIRTGDQVLVLSGKDRAKKGKVLQAFPRHSRVLIEGINQRVKHTRPKKAGQKGQRIEFVSPVHISNVMLVCPKCGNPSRVGYALQGSKKYRRCKSCKGEFD